MLGSKRATTCCDPQYAAAQHGSTAEFLAVPGVIPIPPAFGTPHVPARRPADPLVRDHRRIDLPAAQAAARGLRRGPRPTHRRMRESPPAPADIRRALLRERMVQVGLILGVTAHLK